MELITCEYCGRKVYENEPCPGCGAIVHFVHTENLEPVQNIEQTKVIVSEAHTSIVERISIAFFAFCLLCCITIEQSFISSVLFIFTILYTNSKSRERIYKKIGIKQPESFLNIIIIIILFCISMNSTL